MSEGRLFVEEFGNEGPCIVLLHGGGLSGRMWRPQVERLAGYHCIVPDLPEQGRSAHVAPFDIEDAARRVEELIEERCRVGRAHLVGLSLGGAVALTVARRRPDLLGRVIVSGTAAGIGRMLGLLMKWSAFLYRRLDAERLVKLTVRQLRIPPEYSGMLRQDLAVGATDAFNRHVAEALMTLKLPTANTVPLLVAVGEQETWYAKRAARQIVRVVPQARGVLVPGAGHVWNLQHPDLFTDMVRAWCEERPLPQALRPLAGARRPLR